MHIDYISTPEDFEALQLRWNEVHALDPDSHIFSSWAWFRGFIHTTSDDWAVLAIKPEHSSSYVAFWPLTLRSSRLGLVRTLRPGGSPFADYAGFLCLPAYTNDVLAALAAYIQQNLEWDRFLITDMLDARQDTFLSHFTRFSYPIEPERDLCSPFIPLPDDYETYLAGLSKNTRKKIRRFSRAINALPGFRITDVTADNFDQQVEALFRHWQPRWQIADISTYVEVYRHTLAYNQLWLRVIWTEGSPLAALAAYIDRPKGIFYSYMSSYNRDYESLSPGKVLDAWSIQYAIEQGFTVYDYLRGGHEYKFSLGAQERVSHSFSVMRPTLRSRIANTASALAGQLRQFYQQARQGQRERLLQDS